MIKKFFINHGFSIITIIILTVVFTLGFVFGKYAKSAPSLEAIEREQYLQEQAEDEVEAGPDIVVEQPEKKSRKMIVTATAYDPCVNCCGKSDGITATGVKATAGRTIAVDPSVIPYGTEVVIDGHTYVAEDCGGLVKGNRIDIFFDSHDEATRFGVQRLMIEIREE